MGGRSSNLFHAVRRRRSLAAALAAAVAAVAPPAARAQEGLQAEDRQLVHVLAGDVQVTVGLSWGEVVLVEGRRRSTGEAIDPPEDILQDPAREVWIIGSGRKTRVVHARGEEVSRRTWDRDSGRELDPDLHLILPVALTGGVIPSPQAPPTLAAEAPMPDAGPAERPQGKAFVGAAIPATDLFGESIDGLLPAPDERATDLDISGYVDNLYMTQEDGPSPHVAENGLNGNRGLESVEVVLNLDKNLGDRTRFFGQVRAVRFNAFDFRISMLQIGDPKRAHWRVGRQAHPFGTFVNRNLSDRNPLYGYPLPYRYRSSIRPNAAPAGIAGIIAGRGTGGGGNGVSLAGPAFYQTYALYSVPVAQKARLTFGVSNGSLGANENRTTNDDVGAIARFTYAPNPAWSFGLSGSVAGYMTQGATGLAAGEAPEDMDQQLFGFDLNYARGKFRVQAEGIWSSWDVSANAGVAGNELDSFGWYIESVWQARPKLHLAWRYSAIDFDEIATSPGTRADWDFDVDRHEFGLGFRPTLALLAKLSYQVNETEAPTDPDDNNLIAQLVGKF